MIKPQQEHWNMHITPDQPPTHALLGHYFLFFRFLEIAAIAVLIARPGTAFSYELAAVAVVSIIVSAVRWRGQHAVRVTDLHRWTVLRKIMRTDLADAVADEARQLGVDDRAYFIQGVHAVQDHINRIVHVENEQAGREIGWM
jgi:hypothetical protein